MKMTARSKSFQARNRDTQRMVRGFIQGMLSSELKHHILASTSRSVDHMAWLHLLWRHMGSSTWQRVLVHRWESKFLVFLLCRSIKYFSIGLTHSRFRAKKMLENSKSRNLVEFERRSKIYCAPSICRRQIHARPTCGCAHNLAFRQDLSN